MGVRGRPPPPLENIWRCDHYKKYTLMAISREGYLPYHAFCDMTPFVIWDGLTKLMYMYKMKYTSKYRRFLTYLIQKE
jgi:hypothetical protein